MTTKKLTKLLALYLPYILLGLVATNFGEAWRLAEGKELGDKIMSMMGTVPLAFANPLPSLHPLDILVGLCCGAGLRLAVYLRGKNAKKYRHGMEYGSARWGTAKDIEPFMAPKFADNIILTSSFEKMSGYANDDIRSYNENLTSNVQQLLNKRREKADVFFSFSKALKIPLNLNSSSPNLTPIPLKKPHRANLNEPKPHAQEQQFYIDDSDFENIIKIIHLCGTALEESAKTFNQFNEEALRDYIKGMLSSHYENTVTGETFRRVGKTDIQIQREDKAAFIAECKVWHGIKLFSDAIEQLFCYATWKDTKLSLIIFNKENKNFAGVQQQIQSWLKENCKSCKQWNSNIWDCVKYREDTGRDVRLAVALYDISIKELPNSKKN